MQGTLPSKIQHIQMLGLCRERPQKNCDAIERQMARCFGKTWILASWLVGRSPCVHITISPLSPCSLLLRSRIPAAFETLERCFVLMQPSPKCSPQPLWFPVGHKHPVMIRNRATPISGAASREAMFTTDIHSPFCSHSKGSRPRAERTWKLQIQ